MEQYWQELQQQVHRKAALERKQDALCEQRRKLKEELDAATQCWQEEQKDVDKLEGISLAGIFSALSGRKEEQLEKERQEAQEALLQKEAADNAFQKLEEETIEWRGTMENVWIQCDINVWVQSKTTKKAENLFQILGFAFSV